MFRKQFINGTMNEYLYLTQRETRAEAPAGELSLKQLLLYIPKISLLCVSCSKAVDA